ncbi:MAG TPA: nuclear transport factor 2 family protein [Candidatus Acidoferrum sp.]|nr:nuclear transport factor 2 family protein [Candidatus Acidoferrum sp.]
MNRLVPIIILVAVAVTVQAPQQQEQSQPLEKIHDQGERRMTTKETIQGYFNSLKQKKGWESFLADDMIFTSYTSPIKQVTGKDAYLESTKRFYSGIISFEVKDLLIEGERACALTHYELQSPKGPFTSDVAEIFTVRNSKIASFAIYFDSAPFPK